MKTKLFSTLLLIMVLLVGCYPDGPDYYEDTDVVLTTYDDTYDFTAKSSYARPDKIVVDVEIDRGDTIYEYMKPSFATPIFAAIDANMEALGYELVDISENPDLILTPAALSSTTFFYSYWYDWWYYGYGWYYPPYYTVSSYTTGTMLITMSDPNLASESPINRSPAVWISVANGLASGAYDITRVTESIDKSFEQSPYLKTN